MTGSRAVPFNAASITASASARIFGSIETVSLLISRFCPESKRHLTEIGYTCETKDIFLLHTAPGREIEHTHSGLDSSEVQHPFAQRSGQSRLHPVISAPVFFGGENKWLVCHGSNPWSNVIASARCARVSRLRCARVSRPCTSDRPKVSSVFPLVFFQQAAFHT